MGGSLISSSVTENMNEHADDVVIQTVALRTRRRKMITCWVLRVGAPRQILRTRPSHQPRRQSVVESLVESAIVARLSVGYIAKKVSKEQKVSGDLHAARLLGFIGQFT